MIERLKVATILPAKVEDVINERKFEKMELIHRQLNSEMRSKTPIIRVSNPFIRTID
jgi:hypothetical protein